jgi:hypothetical protein
VGLARGITVGAAMGEDIKLINNNRSLYPEGMLLKKLKSVVRIPDAD